MHWQIQNLVSEKKLWSRTAEKERNWKRGLRNDEQGTEGWCQMVVLCLMWTSAESISRNASVQVSLWNTLWQHVLFWNVHWPLLEMYLLFCFPSLSETNYTQIYHLYRCILKHGTKSITKWKPQWISVEADCLLSMTEKEIFLGKKTSLFFLRQQDRLFSHGGKGSVLVWLLLLAKRIGACPLVIEESAWATKIFSRLTPFTPVPDNLGIYYS